MDHQKERTDKATGAVSVTTGEGAVWRSNPTPDEAAADTLAKGVYKMTMLSQLVIRYVDEDNRSYTATTYANALDSGRRILRGAGTPTG